MVLSFSSFPSGTELSGILVNADHVICRSGYSSVMDLIALGKDAILVPTPGQTEQEYLADFLKEKKLFYSVSQEEFELQSAIREADGYTATMPVDRQKLLIDRIDRVLEE